MFQQMFFFFFKNNSSTNQVGVGQNTNVPLPLDGEKLEQYLHDSDFREDLKAWGPEKKTHHRAITMAVRLDTQKLPEFMMA